MIKTWVLATIVFLAWIVFGLFAAVNDAHAAPTPECFAHLADKETHTTPAADARYHAQRGEPSPCDSWDDQGSASASENRRHDRADDNEEKSRFCRRHWYC